MTSCIIVDDEEYVRESLHKLIDLFCPKVKILGLACDIITAQKLIDTKNPDIVFLDVEMPGGSGFELLESINEPDFQVVFTTAHAAYAIKAIKYAAMDYLLKPIDINELKAAVEKCESNSNNKYLQEQVEVLKSNRKNEDFIFSRIALPTNDGMEFFKLKDIVRCEADRAYCKFHLVDGRKIHISKPMSEYQEILTQAKFIKVHKSSIVNMEHILKYLKGKGGELVMTDGSLVNVAIRRKEDVIKALKLA
jgi:two-component system, LytTR family, response regulator